MKKKLFTEETKDGTHFVFNSDVNALLLGACIGVGTTRKKAIEMAFDAVMNNIRDLTILKEQLIVAAGKKRRRCRVKGN